MSVTVLSDKKYVNYFKDSVPEICDLRHLFCGFRMCEK